MLPTYKWIDKLTLLKQDQIIWYRNYVIGKYNVTIFTGEFCIW